MNIDDVITQVRERNLISDAPQDHVIRRKELEYSGVERLAVRMDPGTQTELLSRELDLDETAQAGLGEWLLIADGDAPLPTIDNSAVGACVDRDGVDALAWYRSFHWSPQEDWGI